ncbi:hypothetical protein RY27_14540 [Litorilinea aerophila]|nr:hypothetical protein RY27_14540 [Litorilinea aerophila]
MRQRSSQPRCSTRAMRSSIRRLPRSRSSVRRARISTSRTWLISAASCRFSCRRQLKGAPAVASSITSSRVSSCPRRAIRRSSPLLRAAGRSVAVASRQNSSRWTFSSSICHWKSICLPTIFPLPLQSAVLPGPAVRGKPARLATFTAKPRHGHCQRRTIRIKQSGQKGNDAVATFGSEGHPPGGSMKQKRGGDDARRPST